MDNVVIKSANTAATLTFCERDGDYFTVVYDSPTVKLRRKIWGYTDCDFLVDLFQFIAKEWKGWDGAKEWSSIEGEFGVSATSDTLGHVMLCFSFKEFESMELWEAKVNLGLDSGQTEAIAKKVEAFFTN